MKRFLDVLRFVIISPEMLFIFLFGFLWFLDFSFFYKVGDSIKNNDEFLKYVLLLPSGFLVLSYGLQEKIRAPLETVNNKQLYEWPLYRMLVDRAIASIFIIGGCAVLSIILWIYVKDMTAYTLGILFSLFVTVSGVCLLLLYFAKSKLIEILTKFGKVN